MAHLFGGGVCRRHEQYPAFVPNTLFSFPQLGGFVFLHLLVQNLPQLNTHTGIFKSLIVSLYFVAGKEVCPGASIEALQQRVPACLNITIITYKEWKSP